MKHIDQVILDARGRYDNEGFQNAYINGYQMGAKDEQAKAVALEQEVQRLITSLNCAHARRDQLLDKLRLELALKAEQKESRQLRDKLHVALSERSVASLLLKAEQEKSQQLRNKLHDSIAGHSEANLLCAERYDKIKALEAENTSLRERLAKVGTRQTVCVITSEGVVECATSEDANRVSALTRGRAKARAKCVEHYDRAKELERQLAAAQVNLVEHGDTIRELQKRLSKEVTTLTDQFTKTNDALRAERDKYKLEATMKWVESEANRVCSIPPGVKDTWVARSFFAPAVENRSVDVLQHQLNIERSVHEQTKHHLRLCQERVTQLSERICHLEARDKILTSFEGTLNALMAQAGAKKA